MFQTPKVNETERGEKYDPNWIRQEIPHAFDRTYAGKPVIYCDYTATSWPLKRTIEAVTRFNAEQRANVHRARYNLSLVASEMYDEAHKKVADLLNADTEDEIAMVGCNATFALNQLAHSINKTFLKGRKRGNIVISEMEHSSNLLPWQDIAKERGYEIRWIPMNINADYTLDMKVAESLIDENTLIIAVMHASNALGTINDVRELTKIAHSKNENALVVVDGVQAVPHFPVDVKELGCDFYVASGHKMMAPHVGIVYGKKKLLKKLEPGLIGGGTICHIEPESHILAHLPNRLEPGTPDIGNVIGLGAMTDFLVEIGMKISGVYNGTLAKKPEERRYYIKTAMEAIHNHEIELSQKMIRGLEQIKDLRLYGPKDPRRRVPTFSINIGEMLSDQLAMLLGSNYEGLDIPTNYVVEARSGCHCAYLALKRITGENVQGTARISLGCGNTLEDVDKILETIETVAKRFGSMKKDLSKSSKLAGLKRLFENYAEELFLSPELNPSAYKKLIELQENVLTDQYNRHVTDIVGGKLPGNLYKGFFKKFRLKKSLRKSAISFAEHIANGSGLSGFLAKVEKYYSENGIDKNEKPWCYLLIKKHFEKKGSHPATR